MSRKFKILKLSLLSLTCLTQLSAAEPSEQQAGADHPVARGDMWSYSELRAVFFEGQGTRKTVKKNALDQFNGFSESKQEGLLSYL